MNKNADSVGSDKIVNVHDKYFIVTRVENDNGIPDIFFGASDDIDEFPEDVLSLKDDFEQFVYLIQQVFFVSKEKNLYHIYYNKVYSLADLAFNGAKNQISLSQRSLDKLKNELATDLAPKIRSKLLIDYLKCSVIPFLIALLTAFFGDKLLFCIYGTDNSSIDKYYLSSFALIAIGAIVGGWLSMAATTRSIAYVDVQSVINNQRGVLIRLLFITAFSIFVAILMVTGGINITLGGLNSSEITSKPIVAITFGFIIGFLDNFFVEKFESQVKKLDIK